jgi:aromatic ring-cleaving dioxygenase
MELQPPQHVDSLFNVSLAANRSAIVKWLSENRKDASIGTRAVPRHASTAVDTLTP